MWRPFRPALCGVILDEESHGFSVDGTAQGLRYGRLGSLRYKGLPWFCRFHCEISGLGRVFEMVLGGTGHWPVPSGDSPDGTERRIFLAPARLSNPTRLAIPVGGSPTGTGGSPVPPILKTRHRKRATDGQPGGWGGEVRARLVFAPAALRRWNCPAQPEPCRYRIIQPELRSWDGKLDQSLDRQRVGKATPGKFCARWWQARRGRSDAPHQRWARDLSFRFHCRPRSSDLTTDRHG